MGSTLAILLDNLISGWEYLPTLEALLILDKCRGLCFALLL